MSEMSSLQTNPLKTNDTPSWRRSAASSSTHSGQHIIYQSGYSRPGNNSSLINTSMPAKEAPPLPPRTLASITSTSNESTTRSLSSQFSEKLNLNENKSIYKPLKPKTANLSSDQEFPSLSSKNTIKPATTATTTTTPSNNYATLARTWGQQKKEDDEKTRKQIKEEADKKYIQRKKEEYEKRFYRLGVSSIPSKQLQSNKNESDDEKYDLGNNRTKLDEDYDSYESLTPDEYEDESDDDDDTNDDLWNRRNKHDLY